jgi:hypothetical protein
LPNNKLQEVFMTTNNRAKAAKKKNMAEILIFGPQEDRLYDFIVDLGTLLGSGRAKLKEEIINETLSSLPNNYTICWRDWGDVRSDGRSSYSKALKNVYGRPST